jgi:hypothetical protein
MTRLSILAAMVVQGERAQVAVAKLIALASVMAAMLDGEARVAIAQQLRAEADMLTPPPDRRALH